MKRFCIVAAIPILAASFTHYPFAGNVYKSYDEQGTPSYSDKRPDREYEIILSTQTGKRQQEENEEQDIAPVRTMESVREITNSANSDIDLLYQDLVNQDETLSGNVTVSFAIKQDGSVPYCSENESSMNKAAFNGKICEKIKALAYGQVESEQDMNVSFTFTFIPNNP